jgi:hypothetical protein
MYTNVILSDLAPPSLANKNSKRRLPPNKNSKRRSRFRQEFIGWRYELS